MEEIASAAARIFISYSSEAPDLALARDLYRALASAGYRPFMAAESIRLGERWPERIERELSECDYFLLLLTPRSAVSEMVIEEVRQTKGIRDARKREQPVILPVRIDLPADAPLSYDLAGYLAQIQQWEWRSSDGLTPLVEEILAVVSRQPGSTDLHKPAAPLGPTERLGPPSPTAEPELPEGQVDLDSVFYVERPPIESDCFQMVERPGTLIRIKAPRQMGKTSLLARVLRRAGVQGHRTVALSFQLADSAVFSNLNDLLTWFCSSITWALDLPDRTAEFWRLTGSKMRATAYFERYLIPAIDAPLTLGLDELDLVFQNQEIAADFLGLLRAWHEAGKSNPVWKHLRLVLVHSTEVYIPLQINQSPFNVGLAIELPEFTPQQVEALALRHGLAWGSAEVERLMAKVGGHPFLVRIALYYIARREITLDQLLATASTEGGLYGDHLRRHLWNLEKFPDLANALRRVVATPGGVRLSSEEAFKLESLGLVTLRGNEVNARSDLYRSYFHDRLGLFG
jgi:serine/threonine-protein kinase